MLNNFEALLQGFYISSPRTWELLLAIGFALILSASMFAVRCIYRYVFLLPRLQIIYDFSFEVGGVATIKFLFKNNGKAALHHALVNVKGISDTSVVSLEKFVAGETCLTYKHFESMLPFEVGFLLSLKVKASQIPDQIIVKIFGEEGHKEISIDSQCYRR